MRLEIIDVHAHYQPRRLDEFMARFDRSTVVPQVPWTDSEEHLEARLKLMRAAGVRLQVLSPGTTHYFEERQAAIEVAELINDRFAGLVDRFPGRFGAYASLPLPHIDASLRELDRAWRLPGTMGATLHCSILDRSVAAEEFDPVYEELNRRRAVLFLHPCRNGVCSALVNDYQLAESVGTSIEDGLAVLHMILRRIPQRFPDIRVIVPHLGGFLAMLLDRLDSQLTRASPNLVELPSVTARRFWYDTVSHGSAVALRCARDAFGADRLLPGSDFPFMLFRRDYGHAFSYVEAANLPADDADKILRRNAAMLFDLAPL